MYVCYLDDSGKDSESHITTLAGYLARDTAWPQFEEDVEPVFEEYGVEVLHAIDLHKTDGEFRNWQLKKKLQFVSDVCMAAVRHELLGLSFSVLKETYQARKVANRAKDSPYGYCFIVLFDWLVTHPEVRANGVSFILERGHQHNSEVRDFIKRAGQHPELRECLGTFCFHGKRDSRAIQLADLFAYYSRRCEDQRLKSQGKVKSEVKVDPILAIINRYLTSVTRVVTDVHGYVK